ncbi:MAG: PASTA domain-containing protein [Deltaproteobacteria bacterium]|nr:PASTA domain-containing protein [Deltaproteobacteria bacterium]
MSVKPLYLFKHVFVFGLVFGLVFWLSIHFLVNEKKEVRVPALIGKTWQQASQEITAVGLKTRVRDRQAHFFAAEGTILTQSLKQGEIVPEGREVYVDVSVGKDPAWKEQVVGQLYRDAQNYFESQNISYIATYHACTETTPTNLVLDATWDETDKKMNVLIEDQTCQHSWILKDLQKGKYIESFQQEMRNQSLQVRLVGTFSDNDKVVTDPRPGSIVQKSNIIIIRKE